MICRRCRTFYPANRLFDAAPGGQESPGTFFWLAGLFLMVALLLLMFSLIVWGLLVAGAALFIFLQAIIAWTDCRGVTCPKCGQRAKVWLWSR